MTTLILLVTLGCTVAFLVEATRTERCDEHSNLVLKAMKDSTRLASGSMRKSQELPLSR